MKVSQPFWGDTVVILLSASKGLGISQSWTFKLKRRQVKRELKCLP